MILYLRFLFYSRNQEPGESFDHFLTDVTKLINDCEFQDKNSMLRDRLVLGMKDKELHARVIRLKYEEVESEKSF